MKKVTTPGPAWGMTLAAALDLFAFVIMAASRPQPVLLMIFGICEILLILCAVGAWKQYIEFRLDQLAARIPPPTSDGRT